MLQVDDPPEADGPYLYRTQFSPQGTQTVSRYSAQDAGRAAEVVLVSDNTIQQDVAAVAQHLTDTQLTGEHHTHRAKGPERVCPATNASGSNASGSNASGSNASDSQTGHLCPCVVDAHPAVLLPLPHITTSWLLLLLLLACVAADCCCCCFAGWLSGISLASIKLSRDHQLLAYGVMPEAAEQQCVIVKDLRSGGHHIWGGGVRLCVC